MTHARSFARTGLAPIDGRSSRYRARQAPADNERGRLIVQTYLAEGSPEGAPRAGAETIVATADLAGMGTSDGRGVVEGASNRGPSDVERVVEVALGELRHPLDLGRVRRQRLRAAGGDVGVLLLRQRILCSQGAP